MTFLDAVKNFAKVTVSTGYDASATSVDLSSGHGAKLPAPATDGLFNLVWWNYTDYPDPSDDPNVEIVRVTARSTDTLTITRAQEGTSASTHNTGGKTYKMALCATAKTITDIADPWKQIFNFTATPASTSTITMGTDQTATIKVGMPLKYVIGGTTYYGLITAIASNLLTVAGAPLSGDVTALYIDSIRKPIVETFSIPGTFADAADTALIANDLLAYYYWRYGTAYLVQMSAIVSNADTGANNSRVNFRIGTTTTDYVCTDNSNAGLTVGTSIAVTVINIDSAKYAIANGNVLEIKTDANGSNDDAKNLTMQACFVLA